MPGAAAEAPQPRGDAPGGGRQAARRRLGRGGGAKYNAVSFSWRRSEADPWQPIPAGQVSSGGTALTA
ncbi:hypothetical protein ATE80_30510 [Streptomyces kanasensis]|uniref:Uncharacterized protein n=1 Tax=Streptomyces kanasensis TaxID=936756 RepID=A0A100Y026_9ACTN|nr:hypothetical protein ATE80_30510 [Streptomyces kanasensis]